MTVEKGTRIHRVCPSKDRWGIVMKKLIQYKLIIICQLNKIYKKRRRCLHINLTKSKIKTKQNHEIRI